MLSACPLAVSQGILYPKAYFDDLVTLLRRKLAPQLSPATERALHLRFVDAPTVTLPAKLLHFGRVVGTRSADKPRRHVKTLWEQDDNGLPACLHLCKTAPENADTVALGCRYDIVPSVKEE